MPRKTTFAVMKTKAFQALPGIGLQKIAYHPTTKTRPAAANQSHANPTAK